MRTILLDDFTSLAIIVWVCLLVTTLGDLFARTDLCVWKKVVWTVAVLTVPMGALAYMALQRRAITDRNAARTSRSDSDRQSAKTSSSSDEFPEGDRFVPMIQHAIEIRGILEAEDPARMTAEPDQVVIGDETASGEHVGPRESNRSRSGHGDHPRFPAVAA